MRLVVGVGVVEDGGDFKILILGSQCLQIAYDRGVVHASPIENDSHLDVMKALSRIGCGKKFKHTHCTH